MQRVRGPKPAYFGCFCDDIAIQRVYLRNETSARDKRKGKKVHKLQMVSHESKIREIWHTNGWDNAIRQTPILLVILKPQHMCMDAMDANVFGKKRDYIIVKRLVNYEWFPTFFLNLVNFGV